MSYTLLSFGKLNVDDGKYALSFRLNQSHTFVACVPLAYVLVKGLSNGTPITVVSLVSTEFFIPVWLLVCYWMSLRKVYIFLEQSHHRAGYQ